VTCLPQDEVPFRWVPETPDPTSGHMLRQLSFVDKTNDARTQKRPPPRQTAPTTPQQYCRAPTRRAAPRPDPGKQRDIPAIARGAIWVDTRGRGLGLPGFGVVTDKPNRFDFSSTTANLQLRPPGETPGPTSGRMLRQLSSMDSRCPTGATPGRVCPSSRPTNPAPKDDHHRPADRPDHTASTQPANLPRTRTPASPAPRPWQCDVAAIGRGRVWGRYSARCRWAAGVMILALGS
jgi:hypothetical protein